MNIIFALDIHDTNPKTIAFTGAGGKSTTMYRLAQELKDEGKSVLVTTTTMIFHPEFKSRPFDVLFTGTCDTLLDRIPPALKGSITVAGSEIIEGGIKLKGFDPPELCKLQESGIFDVILAEADGARGRPIKAPAEYEPVIPLNADILVGVVGLDCIGTKINHENVHRPEIFTKITGTSMGDIIGKDTVLRLLESNKGIFKGASPKSIKIVIFNKCNTQSLFIKAVEIAEDISESSGIEKILITSMIGHHPVLSLIKTKGLKNGIF